MSTYYPSYLQAYLERPSNSDVVSGTVKLALLTSAYTYSASHDFLNDVTGIIGTAVTLGSKTFTNGLWNATVPNYSGAELLGQTAVAALVYIDTGTASTSRLVQYIDDSPSFPLTGLGADQPIVWPAQPIAVSSGSGNDIWYPKYLEAGYNRSSNSDLSGGTVVVIGVDLADYTYSATHEFLSDIPSGARVGTAQTLGSKTFTNGVFDAADITFPSLTGDQIEALAVYIDTGSAATSRLVALKRNIQGFPLTPSGQNQPIAWSSTSGVMNLGATA